MIRTGFPPGGALESANINVAVFSGAPSGRETVIREADVLILHAAEYVFTRRMLVRLGTALCSVLCRNTHVHI